MATFATRLKELRGKSGLSQPQLAQEIGVTKQTISLWERGPRRPDFQTMENLADFFNVKLGYLLGEIDDDTPAVEMQGRFIPSDDVDTFIKYYKGLMKSLRYAASEEALYINFEDLVYNYALTVNKIESFLGLRKKGIRTNLGGDNEDEVIRDFLATEKVYPDLHTLINEALLEKMK